ncbi:glutaredoxin domain-containing cysteine-rich protein 2 [Heteronotia binoei]|uniref:glutaredoxin domain-containing cysteine-rich protein 2 n=1 Tax=Heteronotia binoei TaxID=13085 RepID=UPI00292D0DB2|nr:glutaredoxin domain-containing cysteine-rich protein 2 [Heteronotia binoei]
MDELQKKLNQRHDARPRKVRFKISSAYSGRVLKQVYEDGQELEIPQEEYPHRLRHRNFEPRDHLFGSREAQEPRLCPPPKLNAQRISVFREGSKYTLTSSPSLLNECQANDNRPLHPPILDFGKIIIYTSNLKIIRTSMNKKELVRKLIQNDSVDDWSLVHHEGRGENTSKKSDGDVKDAGHPLAVNQHIQEEEDENSCIQCKGSGSAPCSVCHGSKFSMLANRFKESYRALRCPACNENGLQPCQTCAP